jgi:hypothetical protein
MTEPDTEILTFPNPERPLVFVDTETTGLHADAQVFELGWKREDSDTVNTLIVPHTLYGADPIALKVNRYRERGIALKHVASDLEIDAFRRDATDATLVIANPVFDVPYLMALIGFQVWHYRITDIESYAMPILGYARPQGMSTIYRDLTRLGYQLPEPDHTAGRDVEALESVFHILRSMGEKLLAQAV